MRIYTDCSYDPYKHVCGLGLYIEDGVVTRTISTHITADNNNYGELFAIYLAAILSHGKNCTIYTDSQIAMSFVKGDVKCNADTVDSYERFQRLRLLGYKIRQLKPVLAWVRGHQRDLNNHSIGNQLADLLAKQGRLK